MIRLQILHKGLAFLLLPLALQAILFFTLFNLAVQSEQMVVAQERQVRLVALLDSLLMDFGTGWTTISNQIVGRPVEKRHAPEAYRQEMMDECAEVKQLASERPEIQQIIGEAEAIADVQYRQMKKLESSQTERPSLLGMLSRSAAIAPQLSTLAERMDNIRNILTVEREKARQARLQQESKNKAIKSMLLIGAGAEVLLTIGLLAFFLTDIRRRLSVLMGNARLIPSGQPLTQHVPGNDELADLDTIIHTASNDLRKAADYRNSIMAMVAHDLRSPLLTIKLVFEQLLQASQQSDLQNKMDLVPDAAMAAQRVVRLVEDLLTSDKLDSGKLTLNLTLLDVPALVNDALTPLQPVADGKHVHLVNAVQTLAVEADRQRMLQALDNLISNAIKFSPAGGQVTVTTEVSPTAIKILIADQGPGIPEQQLSQLFSKFYQADKGNQSSGFGLGLSITKQIVEAHKGSVGVISAEGKGSTFWFSLPSKVDLTDLESEP